MKKNMIIFFILILGLNSGASEYKSKYEQMLDTRMKFYPLYFNELQLSSEQISEYEYIIETYNNKYKLLINSENKNLNKEFNKLHKEENKELKKNLDGRQKNIYNLIKHLERQDIKRSLKPKNYYKSNPRMSIFGDLPKK